MLRSEAAASSSTMIYRDGMQILFWVLDWFDCYVRGFQHIRF